MTVLITKLDDKRVESLFLFTSAIPMPKKKDVDIQAITNKLELLEFQHLDEVSELLQPPQKKEK